MAVIGFAGAMYFGSQFVKVNTGASLSYTIPSYIKNALPMDLKIVYVIIAVIGFGILTYGLVTLKMEKIWYRQSIEMPVDYKDLQMTD